MMIPFSMSLFLHVKETLKLPHYRAKLISQQHDSSFLKSIHVCKYSLNHQIRETRDESLLI